MVPPSVAPSIMMEKCLAFLNFSMSFSLSTSYMLQMKLQRTTLFASFVWIVAVWECPTGPVDEPIKFRKLSEGLLLLCNVIGCVHNVFHFIKQGRVHFWYSLDYSWHFCIRTFCLLCNSTVLVAFADSVGQQFVMSKGTCPFDEDEL